jgi:hypothetical protein
MESMESHEAGFPPFPHSLEIRLYEFPIAGREYKNAADTKIEILQPGARNTKV